MLYRKHEVDAPSTADLLCSYEQVIVTCDYPGSAPLLPSSGANKVPNAGQWAVQLRIAAPLLFHVSSNIALGIGPDLSVEVGNDITYTLGASTAILASF